MNIEYRIVDRDGDEINVESFERSVEIPVKIRTIEFRPDGKMIITLEYLHGGTS